LLGALVILIALFGLYLVSPFFTVGEYERTIVTRFGQFAAPTGLLRSGDVGHRNAPESL
jgi:regulator of protease activity HflC (stomatin/prohibitin superfamily)